MRQFFLVLPMVLLVMGSAAALAQTETQTDTTGTAATETATTATGTTGTETTGTETAVAAGTATAGTQTTGPSWVFAANAGYAVPMGSFRDAYKGGISIAVSACYMFTNKYGLEIAGEWSKFSANDDLVKALETASGKDSDASFQFLPIMVGFITNFSFNAPVVPYVKGGLGVYFETAELTIANVTDTRTENDFGFNLGGGVKMPLAKNTAIDVGLRFHNVMTEDESTQYFVFSGGIGFIF